VALSTAMATELGRRTRRVNWILSIAFPSPIGTRRYSPLGVSSASLGHCAGLLEDMGEIDQAISNREHALQRVEWEFSILDPLKEFEQGQRRYQFFGVPVTLQLASPNVQPVDWYTRFSGILWSWKLKPPRAWTLTAASNDLALRTPLRRKIPLLTRYDWPGIPSENVGTMAPLCYGRIDSYHDGSVNGVRCIYVGEESSLGGSRFVVAYRRILSTLGIFANGTEVTNPATGVLVYVTKNGRVFSCIDFSTDRSTQEVIVEVEGYPTNGDGTGTLIENPATAVQHFLNNFVLGEPTEDAWASDSPLLVTSYLAGETADYLDRRPPHGGQKIGILIDNPDTTGEEELNKCCQSHELFAFWTDDGQLAIRADDVDSAKPDPSLPLIEWDQHHVVGPFTYGVESDDVIRSLIAQYGYIPTLGSQGTLEVFDPFVDYDNSESLDMPWGPGVALD